MRPVRSDFFRIKTLTQAYQFYQVLRFSILILLSIILVKLSFTTFETSYFELFLFIVNILTFFWISGIGNSILTYFPRLEVSQQKGFFQSAFFLLQTLGLIASLIFFAFDGFSIFSGYNGNNTILMVSIYIFLYSPTVLVELSYILAEKRKSLINYALLSYLSQLMIISLTAYFYQNINAVFISLIIWILGRWLWTIKEVFSVSLRAHTFSYKTNKDFIIFSLPIIVHILFSNSSEFIDGILVERFFPSDQFSLFRYGAREFPLILVLVGALRTAMIPAAVRNSIKAAAEIRSSINQLMHIFFPLAIVLTFSSRQIYIFFYNQDYAYSAVLFNIYLLTITSRVILAEVFIYASGRNRVFMLVSFLEVIFNITLSLILLRWFGLAGIALASFFAFSLSKAYLGYYVKKYLGVKMNEYINIRTYIIYSALLISSFLITVVFIN